LSQTNSCRKNITDRFRGSICKQKKFWDIPYIIIHRCTYVHVSSVCGSEREATKGGKRYTFGKWSSTRRRKIRDKSERERARWNSGACRSHSLRLAPLNSCSGPTVGRILMAADPDLAVCVVA